MKWRQERVSDWFCRKHGYAFNAPKARPCPKDDGCIIQDYKTWHNHPLPRPEPCSISTVKSAFTCSTHGVSGRFIKVPPDVCPRPARPTEYRRVFG